MKQLLLILFTFIALSSFSQVKTVKVQGSGSGAGGGLTDSTYFWNRLGNYNVTAANRLGAMNNASVRMYANGINYATLDSVGNFGILNDKSYFINNAAALTAHGTNFFIGAAGNLTMTGASNIGTLFGTLSQNTTGNSNIGLGVNVLSQSTTGDGNVGAGQSALLFNRDGSWNVALGGGAGYGQIHGDENVYLGHNVGYGSNATANKNIIIGVLNSGAFIPSVVRGAITFGIDALSANYRLTISDSTTGMRFKNLNVLGTAAPNVLGVDGSGDWHVYPAPSGGTSVVKQTHTSGATISLNNATTWLIVDPASILSALTVTLPASPTDGQDVLISFGGTITSGGVVTSLTLSPAPIDASTPGFVMAGEHVGIRWNGTNSKWYRIN